ncbi:MAG: LysM peptidoglycan-binding domain-containing protein [Myxococcota bacterium]
MNQRLLMATLALLVGIAAMLTERPTADAGPSKFDPEVPEYVVEPGDSLWTITQRIVGDPFLWPKVWAMNPEITNPHWIYPGDIIRFYEADIELPSQGELVAMDYTVDEIGNKNKDELHEEDKKPPIEMVDTSPNLRDLEPPQRFIDLFITPKKLQEAGVLSNASPDKIMLDRDDLVFLTLTRKAQKSPPKAGDRFIVYRSLGRVKHPVNKDDYGYMTQITGVLEIVYTKGDTARARVQFSTLEIERGQLVTPLRWDPLVNLVEVPANKKITGYILAVRDIGGIAGTSEFVFIDKGKSDGITLGNRLSVEMRGDP